MIRPEEQPDGELLRRMKAGDEEAFRTIYRRCQGPIYRFALHMTGNPSIAEDVTQETFMTLIQEPDRFDPSRGPLHAFLFGISRNLTLRRLERERTFVPFPENESPNGSGRQAGNKAGHNRNGDLEQLASPPADLGRSETVDHVRQAVLSLPSNYREVVVLCELQELSYEEAASVLVCAVGTVRSRLHRARVLLTEKLRDARGPKQKPFSRPAAKA